MKKNKHTPKHYLARQATKVLADILSAYETGRLDDPKACQVFCSMLALICEGKIEGSVDDNSMQVKWALTHEYSEEVERIFHGKVM